ncbi:hypothetical protein [Agilicoccus flavus]|uniref:hypothetical protein n=1 Tax=Agilicoccus flavus TaxID=2775968 RepID=UPI001CF636B9|nr:hypothetical protein [Agilicoccus flavus]
MSTRSRIGRTPGSIVGAFLLAAMMFVTAGCGSPSRQVDALPSDFVEAPTASAAARARYGKAIDTAYREITTFSLRQWLQPELLDPSATKSVTAENLTEGIDGRLRPSTRPHWAGLVDRAIAGDAAARLDVALLRFHDWQTPTLTLDSSPVRSQAISGAKIGVGAAYADGTVPLVVTFRQQARVALVNKRAPYPATITKNITFALVPAASKAATSTTTPSAPATSPSTSGTASRASAAATTDPQATWLISAFEGTLDIDFDRAESDSTTTPAATDPTPAASTASAGTISTSAP